MKKTIQRMAFSAVALLALTGCDRSGTNYYFNVSPAANQQVAASTTAVNFTVSTNVLSWEVLVDNAPVYAGVSGDNQTYSVIIPENTDTAIEKSYIVTFRSTDPAFQSNIIVIITQAAAPVQPQLEVTPTGDHNVADTDTWFDFNVTANVSWTCSLDGTQVDNGSADKAVRVTFPANTDTSAPVIHTVIFESADPAFTKSHTIQITQAAAPIQPYLEINPSANQTVAHDVTSFTFAVEANVAWSCEVDGTQAKTGTGDDAAVLVTFPANASTSGTATRVVTFESTDPSFTKTVTVNITQEAAPIPTVTHTETFATFTTAKSDYTTTGSYTSTEVTGVVWSYKGATNQVSTKFILGKNAADCYVRSNSIAGGVGSIKVDWKLPFSDTNNDYSGTSFIVLVNGTQVGRQDIAKAEATAGKTGTLTIDNINVSGNVTISVESNGGGRPGVNAIEWTTYGN